MNTPTYAELEQFYRNASAAGYRLRLEPRFGAIVGWVWTWHTPDKGYLRGYTDADSKAAALVFAAMDPQLSAH